MRSRQFTVVKCLQDLHCVHKRVLGCVAVETRVHTSANSLAFKIVTHIIICITTKNARESLGLMHTSGCEPSIAPSAKEARRSGVGEGEEKAFQFQR